MDIENIVEKRLIKEMHHTELVDITHLASQISSDIKKELKLVASGEVKYDDTDGGYTEVGDVWLGNLGGAYHGKNINVWIEEIL